MATATDSIEDDEAWLYGDSDDKEADKKEAASTSEKDKENGEKKEAEALTGEGGGEEKGSEEEEDDEEEDSDDDDDVQITIGDIKTSTSYDAPKNLFRSGSQYHKSKAATITAATTKGVDIEAQGTINGVPTFDFDLTSLQDEDRAWRKPGADITDYFNYGFTEDSWNQYCKKQRNMREMNTGKPVFIHPTGPPRVRTTSESKDSTAGQSADDKNSPARRGTGIGNRAAPPPDRKMSGTIDVIGGMNSRRPTREYVDMPPPADDFKKPYNMGPQPVGPPGMQPPHIAGPEFGMPPTSLPPPGMPPTHLPPPAGMAPSNVGHPPPQFAPPPDPYDNYYPPPQGGPPQGHPGGQYYDNSYNNPYGGGPPPSGPPPFDPRVSYPPPWGGDYQRSPNRSDSGSDDERRFREGGRGGGGGGGGGRDYDYGRREERSRSHDRERRHRDRGDREDRHRRRRHREEGEDEHSRSRHKKSKRSKRDREEEPMESGGAPAEET